MGLEFRPLILSKNTKNASIWHLCDLLVSCEFHFNGYDFVQMLDEDWASQSLVLNIDS